MTKADLIEQAADVTGQRVTKKDCALVVDAFLDAVKNALARGDHIEIRGFGTYKVRRRKARKALNPRTGRTGAGSTTRCAGLQTFDASPRQGGRRSRWESLEGRRQAVACPPRPLRWPQVEALAYALYGA